MTPGRERPTAATVFGILNIIFGALGLLCSPFALAGPMFQQPNLPNGQPNPMIEIMNDPTYKTGITIFTVIGMAASGILLAAGIGLLKQRPWGRSLSIGYSVYALVMALVSLGFNYYALIGPLTKATENMQGPETTGMVIGAYAGALGGLCGGLIYPILLWIFMSTEKVKRFYQGQTAHTSSS
jgi:hypothetical protein